jgi:hypothetical protein
MKKNKILVHQSFFRNDVAACFLLDTQHHYMFGLISQQSSGVIIQKIPSVSYPYEFQRIR